MPTATPALAKNRSTGPNAASAASIRRDVAGLGGHVGDDRHGAVEVVGHRGRIEDVGDDDAGAGGVEAPGQGGADPACCSGDDHVGAGEFHGRRA